MYIKNITDNDILPGRGNGSNNSPGNQKYRHIIKQNKVQYDAANMKEKREIAASIFNDIKQWTPTPGRFLKKAQENNWEELTEKKAIDKIRQSLRDLPSSSSSPPPPSQKSPKDNTPEIPMINPSEFNDSGASKLLAKDAEILLRGKFFTSGSSSESESNNAGEAVSRVSLSVIPYLPPLPGTKNSRIDGGGNKQLERKLERDASMSLEDVKRDDEQMKKNKRENTNMEISGLSGTSQMSGLSGISLSSMDLSEDFSNLQCAV